MSGSLSNCREAVAVVVTAAALLLPRLLLLEQMLLWQPQQRLLLLLPPPPPPPLHTIFKKATSKGTLTEIVPLVLTGSFSCYSCCF